MWQRVVLHVVVGALLGYGYHRLMLPISGGTCPLICSPWRAMLIGAVFGLFWPAPRVDQAPAAKLDLAAIAGEGDTMSSLTVQDGVPVHVNEDSFAALVHSAKTPILLDAYADWCGPCKMLAPQLEEVAKGLSGRVIVAKLNVDESPRLAGELGIRGIPALFLINGTQLVDQWTGYSDADSIQSRIEPKLPAPAVQ